MSIVICDDHEMFLAALVDALVDRGHEVAAATSDPRALPDLVHRHRPDLVLLDVNLVDACGLEVADALRERCGGVPVVLLTASTEPRVRHAYDARMVAGLVSKSSGIRALDAAIVAAVAGERVLVGWPAAPATPSDASPLSSLTSREREVLLLMVNGVSTVAMAQRLGVSVNTVRTHVRNVLRKLGVRHRTKAAHAALELGLAAAG